MAVVAVAVVVVVMWRWYDGNETAQRVLIKRGDMFVSSQKQLNRAETQTRTKKGHSHWVFNRF